MGDAFEGAVRQLGGLFAPECSSRTLHDKICEILGREEAGRHGVDHEKVINKLRRARAVAREQAREQLEPAQHAPREQRDSADEAEDKSTTSDTPEVLPPSGEFEPHIPGAAATGVAAPVAVCAVWRVARLVASVAWAGALVVLVTADRTLAVAVDIASRDLSATLNMSLVDASTLACAATSETAEAAAICLFAFAAFAALHSSGTVGAASGRAAATCLVALGLVLLRGEIQPERALCARALLPGATAAINVTGVP